MVHLTLAGLSEDRTRLLLVDDQGREFTLDVDANLRAALRGDDSRLGTLEIHMDSALRPRDIQQRIRAGETAEAVAAAAQTTVEKIMPFAAPVLAERAHMADRAQRSSVRRVSDAGSTGAARTLGDAVAAQLRSAGLPHDSVEWDSARREDGRWSLTARWTDGKREGEATYSFDHRGNFVVADNDDARWLVGDGLEAPAPSDQSTAGERRLSAVPDEDLPLGDDAIELVSESEPPAAPARRTPRQPATRPDEEPVVEPAPRRTRSRRRTSREEPGFFDAVFARSETEEGVSDKTADQPPPDDAPTTEQPAVSDHDQDATADAAADPAADQANRPGGRRRERPGPGRAPGPAAPQARLACLGAELGRDHVRRPEGVTRRAPSSRADRALPATPSPPTGHLARAQPKGSGSGASDTALARAAVIRRRWCWRQSTS